MDEIALILLGRLHRVIWISRCNIISSENTDTLIDFNILQQHVTPKGTNFKTDMGSFSVAAPRLWNHLPTKLKSCQSITRFKSLLT